MSLNSGKRLFSPSLTPRSSASNEEENHLLGLPDDLLFGVTAFLDVRSLLTMRQINKKFYTLASRDEAGWTSLCHNLWKDKVHVLDEACCRSMSAMDAYRRSLQDATERQCLTLDELCYDESTQRGTIWSLRFKEAAGPDWTRHDPWYNGLPTRKMVFLRDGSVKQYLPITETTDQDAGSGGNRHILVTPNFGDDRALAAMDVDQQLQHQQSSLQLQRRHVRRHHLRNPHHNGDGGVLANPPLSMTWRFLKRPIDLPHRPLGSYIRVTVGGRDVPTYVVRRSPTGNWGFVLESLWCVYASFELPPRRVSNTATETDATLFATRPPHQQPLVPLASRAAAKRSKRRRRDASGSWVQASSNDDSSIDDDDDEDDDAESISIEQQEITDAAATAQRNEILMSDSEMLINNDVQWREAYLYNWGARALPDGDMDGDDFDRALLNAVMEG